MSYRLLGIITALILATTASTYAVTATVHIEVESGGTKSWNPDNTAYSCWWPGTTCKIIKMSIIANQGTIIPSPKGLGYLLTIPMESIIGQAVNGADKGTTEVTLSGFKFETGMGRVVIDDCPDFPSLKGVAVSLNGQVVGNDGKMTVYIP